jgi:HEPN domain-containing protein
VKGNPRFVGGTLRRGLDALEGAEAAFERRRYALVVSLAQQAVELALKAGLRWAGLDPPRQHDVGDLLLARGAKFPAWFRLEVPYLRESSELLARLREPATYGSPSEDRSPSDLFADPVVAEDALGRARRVCILFSRLINPDVGLTDAEARTRP